MSDTQQQIQSANDTGYPSAVGMAIVAAVFSLFIAVLLGVNAYHRIATDPVRAAALEKMKEQAKAAPADEALAEDIQRLDTRLRRDQFARLYLLRRGTLLLVVTLVLFVGAIVWAKSQRRRLPVVSPPGDLKTEQVEKAGQLRLALTCGVVLLCAGGLFWGLHAPSVPAEEAGEPTYASMDEAASQWPVFRGPGGLGHAKFENIPQTWDGQTGQQILWKTPVPLPGFNSPVVWDDRLFLTGATDETQQVFCYDTETGRLLWQREVSIPSAAARREMNIMEDTGYAACTAATDGRRVCALFAGGDLGCFTIDGRPLWEKHFGIPESMYGYAASLTWFENLVIVQWDVGFEGEDSKLIALDWQTGQVVWETPRPVGNSWSSPTVVSIDGSYRVVTNASPFTIVYDPKTGTELYRVDCVYGDIAATPIAADGKIFAIEPYNKLVAIHAGEAPAAESRIAWESSEEMPDICSPVSNGKLVWTLTTPGYLSCFDIADGTRLYREPLKLQFQASPVLVGDLLYLLADDGTMLLAETGTVFKEIGRQELGETCHASPAFAPGRIYIRGEDNLYAIGSGE